MSRRKILIGAFVGVGLIAGTLWTLDKFGVFGPSYLERPKLAETPSLKPYTRTSTMTVPVGINLALIRSSLDAAVPRNVSGKRANAISGPFGMTHISWNIDRNEFTISGKPDGLTMSAALSGTLRVSAGETTTASLKPENRAQDFNPFDLEQRGEVRGHATLTAKPTLLPNWRIDPKLTGRVAIPDGGLKVAGFTIDVSGDVKSGIDHTVSEQLNNVQNLLRNDSTIEQVARREWAKICRSISLAGIAAGNQDLWLELRPIRAFAAHPQLNAEAASVTLGAEAETRIVASETKPDCPFPAQLDIIPPVEQGHFAIAAPIEVPFTEINRRLESQLKGQVFPTNADAAAQFKVFRVLVEPSGKQLLISLQVEATEQKTWFNLGAKATIYIWVTPVLDSAQQKLQLTDMVLDVRSAAAFGLFGAAARLAAPYIQADLEPYAVIDLKSYVASARTGIEAAVADFDKQDDGISASASVSDLRLVGVEFDSKMLRLSTEAEGTAKIALTKLPMQ